MITMYRKDGKKVTVGFDQVEIMKEAGYLMEAPEVIKDEKMPDKKDTKKI